jgi:hypothetical protein
VSWPVAVEQPERQRRSQIVFDPVRRFEIFVPAPEED